MTAKDLGHSATYMSHISLKTVPQTLIQYVITKTWTSLRRCIDGFFRRHRFATMVGYDNTNYFSTRFTRQRHDSYPVPAAYKDRDEGDEQTTIDNIIIRVVPAFGSCRASSFLRR